MSQPTAPPAALSEVVAVLRRVPRRWKQALLAAEAVCAYIFARLLFVDGPGAFPSAGAVWARPGYPKELKLLPNKGYDGEFVYRLAIDPFTTQRTAHGIVLDVPAYRQQRIMTAILGRIVSTVPGISTGVALIIVNSLAVVVAIVAGLRLAEELDRRPFLGVALAVPAGVVIGLVGDMTEPVAWASVLLAIVAARRERWLPAAAFFAMAMLARETAAIVLAGFIVESVFVIQRERTKAALRRLWLLAAVAVETGWQVWLWHVWGSLPAISGLRNTGLNSKLSASQGAFEDSSSGWPGLGIAQNFLHGLTGTTDKFLGACYLIERVMLLGLIVTAGVALVRRRAQPGLAITVAWALAATLALSLSSWSTDIQLLRASTEVWGLSIFVLMTARMRGSRTVLVGAALVTAWVAVYFLPRG